MPTKRPDNSKGVPRGALFLYLHHNISQIYRSLFGNCFELKRPDFRNLTLEGFSGVVQRRLSRNCCNNVLVCIHSFFRKPIGRPSNDFANIRYYTFALAARLGGTYNFTRWTSLALFRPAWLSDTSSCRRCRCAHNLRIYLFQTVVIRDEIQL